MQQDKKRKSVPIGKKDIELSLFAGDMILYAEKPKELTNKQTKTPGTNKQL